MGAFETMFDVCCKQIVSVYSSTTLGNLSSVLALCHNLTLIAIDNHKNTGVLDFEEVSPVEIGRWLNGVLFVAVVVATVVLNSLSIFIFSTASMRSPTNLLLTTISVLDLLTCACQVPLNIFVYFQDGYKHLPEMAWCDVYNYVHNFLPSALHSTSFLLNTCLSVQRCVGVKDITRWRAHTICSYKGTLISILTCTLLSFLVHSIYPISFGVEEVHAIDKQMLSSGQLQLVRACKVAPRYPKTFDNWLSVYIWARVGILQVCPAVFLCVCNIVLIRASYKTYAYRKKLLGAMGAIANLSQAFVTEETVNEAAVSSAEIELLDNGEKQENSSSRAKLCAAVVNEPGPKIIVSRADGKYDTRETTQDTASTQHRQAGHAALIRNEMKAQRCARISRLNVFKIKTHTEEEKSSHTDNSKPEESLTWWDFLREHVITHSHNHHEQPQQVGRQQQQQQIDEDEQLQTKQLREQRHRKSDETITWWDFLREHVLPHGHHHQHQKRPNEELEQQQEKNQRLKDPRKSEEVITWWDFLREHVLSHGGRHPQQQQDTKLEQQYHQEHRPSQAIISWWDFLQEHLIKPDEQQGGDKQQPNPLSTQRPSFSGSCSSQVDNVFEDPSQHTDLNEIGERCKPVMVEVEKEVLGNRKNSSYEEVSVISKQDTRNRSTAPGTKEPEDKKTAIKHQHHQGVSDEYESRRDSHTSKNVNPHSPLAHSPLAPTESNRSGKSSGHLKSHEFRSSVMLLLVTSCTLIAEILVIILLIFQFINGVLLMPNQFLSRSRLAVLVMSSNFLTLLTFPLNFLFFCGLSQSFRTCLRAKLQTVISCVKRER